MTMMQVDTLDINTLRAILTKYAPDVDAEGDGVYGLKWTSTETFYRHTEEYVAPEKKLEYKHALEMAFPGKKGVL